LEGEQEFVAACLRLDRERVRTLVAEHPEYLRSPKAILAAAERDRADVVAMLLDLGVPIEIENELRQRPLHAAAWSGSLTVARLLIERGADIDPRDTQYQNTALDYAVYLQNQPMIELLSQYSRDIWNLVFTGNVERVRAVLHDQPELALLTDDGHTPLTWLPEDEAAAAEIVRLFLAHGANARIMDGNGLTAADHASRRGLEEAASLLRAVE
jgi:ankyrin repeat protein